MIDFTNNGIAAILTGGVVLVGIVLFKVSAEHRRGTLALRTELPFVLGLLALLGVLALLIFVGQAAVLVVPPLILVGGGVYLLAIPRQEIAWGVSTRQAGVLTTIAGVIVLALGLIRLLLGD